MSFYTDHTDSVVLRHGDNARIQVLRDSDQDYANVLHCWGAGTGVNRLYLELRNEEAIAERAGEEVHADFETDTETYAELQAQGEIELAKRSTIQAQYTVEILDPDLPYIGVGDRVLVVDPRTGSVMKTEVTDESRSWSPTGEVVELGLGGGTLASPIENIIRTQGRKPRTSLGKRPRPPQNVRTKTLFDGIRLEWTGNADAWEIWHVKGEQEPSEKDWDRLARVTSAEYDHLGLAFGEGHWYRIISVVGTRTSEPVIVFARAGKKVQEDDIDQTPPEPPVLGTLTGQAADLGDSRYDIRVVVPFTTDDRTRKVIFERREGTDGDWTEVGQAHSSPWIDRHGLKTETTYYYRARAESGTGVLSSLSNTRQVTIGTASVRPAMVTGLAVDFEGSDLVVTWDPVAGATSYRVEIVGRRTVMVEGTSYRYTLQDNKLDGGGVPAPILVVRVWARNAFGNESLQYAEMSAVHPTPAKPTGLVAIPVVGGFVLTWDHHSPPPPLDKWVLQRASSEDDYATWQTVNDEIRSAFYTDVDALSYDYQYKYRLIAVSLLGRQSDPSDETTPDTPGKVSLASQVIGRLARGQLAEEIIAELDGIVQIQEDLEDLSGDVSAVVQTADELSQTVAQVEDGLTQAQSAIQQNATSIDQRLMVVDENGNPVVAAQIKIAQKDGQGNILVRADNILMEGSVGVRELSTLGGGTQVTDDGVKILEGGSEYLRVGDVGGLPWGSGNNTLPANTKGIWGDQAGLFLRGYARLLDAGYKEDEEEIDLSDFGPLGEVEILVAPKDLVTYSPERDTVSRMYIDAVKQSETLYVVKAKVMVEGTEHIWGGRSNTRNSWTYTRPTDSIGGKKGVFTDFIICRPTWWVSSAGFGAYTARLWMDITNEFNQAGDPINWQTVRTFSRSSSGSGTLNWDTAVEFDQWAVRVRGQGDGAVLVSYAETGLNRLGYRTGTTYLDKNGVVITDPNPGSVPSGMSVLYMVLDRG